MPRARRVGPQHLTGCDEVGFVPLHEGRWTGSSRQVLTPPPFLRKKKRTRRRPSFLGWMVSWQELEVRHAGTGWSRPTSGGGEGRQENRRRRRDKKQNRRRRVGMAPRQCQIHYSPIYFPFHFDFRVLVSLSLFLSHSLSSARFSACSLNFYTYIERALSSLCCCTSSRSGSSGHTFSEPPRFHKLPVCKIFVFLSLLMI